MAEHESFNKVHFSSKKIEWETPQDFFDKLDKEFEFVLDVCALPENAKCMAFFTPEDDGLSKEWFGPAWMNPPYGREIKKWVKKAYDESKKGITVVCLVPSRTDTAWWHDYIMKADDIRFIRGRLQFGNSGVNAPFPNAVIVFRGK